MSSSASFTYNGATITGYEEGGLNDNYAIDIPFSNITTGDPIVSVQDLSTTFYSNLQLNFSNATNLQKISDYTFEFSTGITSVNFSNLSSLTYIGTRAFYNCSKITSLDVSDLTNLSQIGSGAFAFCTGLTSLDLSNLTNLTNIKNSVFVGCSKITSVNLSNLSNLTTLGAFAFASCTGITSLDLSDLSGLITLEEYVFYNCTGITSVDFGNLTNLTYFGNSVFEDCAGITSVDLSGYSTLTYLGNKAFKGCTGITSVNVSGLSNFTYLGSSAFENCTSISSPITLPESLQTIGLNSFLGVSQPIFMETDFVNLQILHSSAVTISPAVLPQGLLFDPITKTLEGVISQSITITFSGSPSLTITFSPTVIPCFLAETKLLTSTFEYKKVSEITTSDLIQSPFSSEPQKIKQIMKKEVDFKNIDKNNRPMVIRKDFFEKNLPSEDVFVSVFHRIILHKDNQNLVGIQAFKLSNSFLSEEEIENTKENDKLFYYHIELEDQNQHLIASNLSVESYQNC
jgi:hypothetical protein